MSDSPAQKVVPIMTTERLLLVIPDVSMAEAMRDYAVRNMDFHRAAMPTPPDEYTTLAYWRERLTTRLEQYRTLQLFGLLLLDRASGAILGDCTFSQVYDIPQRSAVLGYKLDRAAEGKGIMTEGLRAALGWAWDTIRLHRVEANVRPENQRSLALLKRLGFAIEGYSEKYLFLDGAWRDHLRLAAINPEHGGGPHRSLEVGKLSGE